MFTKLCCRELLTNFDKAPSTKSSRPSSRDSEGKYQDDIEDAMVAAGMTSRDKREKAKREKEKKERENKEKEKKREQERQAAARQAMIDAGKVSRERRKQK